MRIDGKFNSAVVKASIIDEATISQIKEMCEIEDFRDNNTIKEYCEKSKYLVDLKIFS